MEHAESQITDYRDYNPRSEFLKPLHEMHGENSERYARAAPHIRSFAGNAGTQWTSANLSLEELELSTTFRERSIWNGITEVPSRYRRKGLGAGEAEACAVAVTRGWTLLIDDQAAVDLLTGLGYDTPCLRTCMLLTHAVKTELMPCTDAAELFNHQIVDFFGFNAVRNRQTERLWLRCEPEVGCVWEVI
jgi:predicted nucleic acid-binding protein